MCYDPILFLILSFLVATSSMAYETGIVRSIIRIVARVFIFPANLLLFTYRVKNLTDIQKSVIR